jgi:hypothetical protein
MFALIPSAARSRGAPIAAIEAGTVAYTGNELRGYGNLVLIKHTDGWISAYAHCDELLVKKRKSRLGIARTTESQSCGAFGPLSQRAISITTTRKAPANASAATVAQSIRRNTCFY